MKELKDLDYVVAAQLLGCDVPAVKAVKIVEAPKGGFLPDGRLTILFEAHLFSSKTKHVYDKTHPDISAPKWDRKLYVGGAGEWNRLEKAKALNETAALESASFGMFQILGGNFKECGYNSARELISSFGESERNQLFAFVRYIQTRKLDVYLRNHDWANFARLYNGPMYKQNEYDKKLEAAHQKAAA
jgi:hypothetical protein